MKTKVKKTDDAVIKWHKEPKMKVDRAGCRKRHFCKCGFKTDDYYAKESHVCKEDELARRSLMDESSKKKLHRMVLEAKLRGQYATGQ